MTVINAKSHECSFEDYLELVGKSYSGIKNEGVAKFKATPKMMLGTAIHNYLLTPAEFKHENTALIRPLALALKQRLGTLIRYLKPEIGITADFQHNGFSMAYKGRIDLCIFKKIVIDIKVTEMDIFKAIDFFGYDKQQNGYAAAIGAEVILILSIHPKTKKTEITNIPISTYWWEQQVQQKGKIII